MGDGMSFFAQIDAAILNACTSFSHRLQRTVGLTNYFVAKIGIALTALSCVVDVLNYVGKFLDNSHSLIGLILDFAILTQMIFRSILCSEAEETLGDPSTPTWLLFYLEIPFWRLFW